MYDPHTRSSGVLYVDTKKFSHQGVWERIDEVIRDYSEIHPNEMRMLVLENRMISEERKNGFASTGNKSMRWGASVPPGLMFKLETVEPRLFADKHLFHAFLRKYKGFRICKVV